MNGIHSKQLSARQIFTAAVSLSDPAQLKGYLREACGNDPVLRQKVELLLQALEGLNLHKDEIPPKAQRHIKATIDRLIQMYESTNRPDEVVRWKAKLPENLGESP